MRTPAWIRVCGTLLAVVSVAWVAPRFVEQWGWVQLHGGGTRVLTMSLVLSPLYAVALVVLAVAWWWLCGPQRPSVSPVLGVWLRSQVAKYLPGNFLHYLGRHLLGIRLGMDQKTLATATALEIAGTAAAAALLASPAVVRHLEPVAALLLLFGISALALGVAKIAIVGRRLKGWIARRQLRFLLPALLLYFIFFGISGLLYRQLVGTGLGLPLPLWKITHAVATAWLVGTFTPGAPGGLGVREVLLTLQLAPSIGEGNAAVAAVAWRLTTIAGDVVASLVGWWIGRRIHRFGDAAGREIKP